MDRVVVENNKPLTAFLEFFLPLMNKYSGMFGLAGGIGGYIMGTLGYNLIPESAAKRFLTSISITATLAPMIVTVGGGVIVGYLVGAVYYWWKGPKSVTKEDINKAIVTGISKLEGDARKEGIILLEECLEALKKSK